MYQGRQCLGMKHGSKVVGQIARSTFTRHLCNTIGQGNMILKWMTGAHQRKSTGGLEQQRIKLQVKQ
jgi:hypothetical protein